jgi:hypothetical protein
LFLSGWFILDLLVGGAGSLAQERLVLHPHLPACAADATAGKGARTAGYGAVLVLMRVTVALLAFAPAERWFGRDVVSNFIFQVVNSMPDIGRDYGLAMALNGLD